MPSRISRLAASPWRNLVGGLVFVALVIGLATVAYVLSGWSWGDAFYFVIITVFTVGYEEVHPIVTGGLRALTIGTIILGCTGITFLTVALVQFITIAQIQELFGSKRMKTQIAKMTGHVIVCGYGRIGQMLADELHAGGAEFVIVDVDDKHFAEATARGYATWKGDATEEAVLETVGVHRARALATVVPNDAVNVFITLSARNLNKELEIIARGEAASTKSKLLQAGASSVVEPTHIGAERIAQLLLFPRTSIFTDNSSHMRLLGAELHTLGLDMEVMAVAPDSPLAGATIDKIERKAIGSLFIIAINRKSGETSHPPRPVYHY